LRHNGQGCQIFLGTEYQNGEKIQNYHDLYQMSIKYNKRPQNGPRVHKCTNIFYCKTLQNLPKFVFLVRKQTIWQPCHNPPFFFLLSRSNFLSALTIEAAKCASQIAFVLLGSIVEVGRAWFLRARVGLGSGSGFIICPRGFAGLKTLLYTYLSCA
jgi:hypothetical protein